MDNIKEATLDQLVESIIKAQAILEETEAGIRVLKDEIGDRMKADKISGTKVGNYLVSRIVSTIFSGVPISEAREYGATKTEERNDLSKLKKLYEKGIKFSGVRVLQYVKIKEIDE